MPNPHEPPEDSEIAAIAEGLKNLEAEIFLPNAQFKAEKRQELKQILQGAGYKTTLRFYDNLEDIARMIDDENREKSIVMTLDITDESQLEPLIDVEVDLRGVRFMNFESLGVDSMPQAEYGNYTADTVTKLLLARAITQEEANEQSSAKYRFLAHLLHDHFVNESDGQVARYIGQIADDTMDPFAKLRYVIETILRAAPVDLYGRMKSALQVFWSV